MNIIGLQIEIAWEDKAANHAKVLSLLDRVKPQPGSLVALPEMFATGFSMNVAGIHDTDSRETQSFLSQTAVDYRIYLLGGVVVKDASGRGRNECVIYAPDGSEFARYTKLQPFTLGGESANYLAGESTRVFSLEEFNLATFICYDLRFPEIFRSAARRNANLYSVIACWPIAREEHWVTLLKARAIENQSYIIGVNQAGRDPKFTYPGRSLIIHPSGDILADAGREEGWISAQIDLDELHKYRKALPFLADLRDEYVKLDGV